MKHYLALVICFLVPVCVRPQTTNTLSPGPIPPHDMTVFAVMATGVPGDFLDYLQPPAQDQAVHPASDDTMIDVVEQWLGQFFQKQAVPDREFVAKNLLLAPAGQWNHGKEDVAFLPMAIGNYEILFALTPDIPVYGKAVLSVFMKEAQPFSSSADACRIVGGFSSDILLYTWSEWTPPKPISQRSKHSKILQVGDFIATQVSDHYEVVPKIQDIGGRFDTMKAVVFKQHFVLWFNLYGPRSTFGAMVPAPDGWFQFEKEKAKR